MPPWQHPTLPPSQHPTLPIAASYRAQLAEFRKGVRAVLSSAAACNLSLQRTLHLEELVRACAHVREGARPHQSRIRARPLAAPLAGTPSGNPYGEPWDT